MKRLSYLSAGVLCGALTSSAFAYQFTCKPMGWDEVSNEDKIYTFAVKTECTLNSDKPLKIVEIKGAYEKFLTKSRDFRIKSNSNVQQNSNMSGKLLTFHESRSTKHGELEIDGKIFLLDDSKAKFRFDYTSDNIDGHGNAKYTQYEKLEMDLTSEASPNTYRLLFKQTNDVRKPSLAPKGVFIRKAKEGIEEDLAATTDEHLAIILGN